MENKELYDLLNRSFHGEVSENEQSELDEALSKNQELKVEHGKMAALQSLFAKQDFRFQPFFAGRLMNRIDSLRDTPSIFSGLDYAFMRISLPTMLALGIWVLVFWSAEGSLSVDNFLGVANLSYDELVSDYFVSN